MMPEHIADRWACWLESHPAQYKARLVGGPGEFDPACCLGHAMRMLGCEFKFKQAWYEFEFKQAVCVGAGTGVMLWADTVFDSYNVLPEAVAKKLGMRTTNGEFHSDGSDGSDVSDVLQHGESGTYLDISDLLDYSGYDIQKKRYGSLAEMNDNGVPLVVIAKVIRRYHMYL